jgi:alpha-glucosidase (family GH31 glycosyl hydrolase)
MPVLLAVSLFRIDVALAADAVLESSSLRVEVTAAPYSFAVIEKATGTVLISESQVTFTVGEPFAATGASITGQTSTTLDATLVLGGTGDIAHVRFALTSPEVVQVQLSYNNGTPTNIKEQFVDQGEHVYGIWGFASTATGINLDARGADRDLIGVGNSPGSNWANSRAPFYVTSEKYGVYADSIAKGHYTVAVGGQTSFNFDAPQLTYYVIYGPAYGQILNRYNGLAGGSLMPPLWAFDTIFWRDDHHQDFTANGVTNAQALVKKDADNLQQNQIPASAIWLDRPYGSGPTGGVGGWGNFDFDPGPTGFPDPDAMIADLGGRGMHLLLWIANRSNNSMFTDPLFAPYMFTIANGWDQNYTTSPAVDLRQPIPYAHFQDRLDNFVNRGVRGYKIDRGEEGELPAFLQNEMTVLDDKMAFEGMHDTFGDDIFLFARNVYDRSRQYVATWNGDTHTDFTGLVESVKMMTRNGAILFPMSGSDTGGYSGGTPTKELFARWFALNAHVTMMEVLLGPNRTPWNNYNAGADLNPPLLIDVARKFTQEHHDLIPYTRSYLYQATKTGWPVMRMMPFAFPDDSNPALFDMWDQYLFGDALLVAPVTVAGATSRPVYLPAGEWLDYNDKRTHFHGPATVNAAAPLDVIPRYVKAGAIVPRGDILKANNNWTANWSPNLHIEFFPADGIASAFDYYTGRAIVPIAGGLANNTVDLRFDELGTPGKVEIYNVDRYSTVKRNGQVLAAADFQYDAAAQRLTVFYAGTTDVQINVAPAVDAGPDATIFKGATFTQAGSFFEIGGTSFTATVDYGDGTGEQPLALDGASFMLNHAYANIGSYTVVVKVTDDAGHVGTDTVLVTVVYRFTGFFPPVANVPTQNAAHAGSVVPIKFSLSGYQDATPFTVESAPIACDSGQPLGAPETALSPGASGVQYDSTTDQYQFNWKTDAGWAGTCRQLIVTTNDNVAHGADFEFR